MSWQIDLFRVAPGQDPCRVRDVQYGDAHEGYSLPTPSPETDRWIQRALAALEVVTPDWKVDDDTNGPAIAFDSRGHVKHVRLWQPDGPLVANVYPDVVDVRVQRGRAESHDGENFEALWRTCKALAEHAECAAFPQYDDEPVDTTLELEQARTVYDDWA